MAEQGSHPVSSLFRCLGAQKRGAGHVLQSGAGPWKPFLTTVCDVGFVIPSPAAVDGWTVSVGQFSLLN